MAIDRARRAARRWEMRSIHPDPAPRRVAVAVVEIESFLNPGRKQQLEHLEWVAVAKEDERESGAGPLDLDSGIVQLRRR